MVEASIAEVSISDKIEKSDKKEDFYAVVSAIVKFIEEADRTSQGISIPQAAARKE